MYFSRRNVFVKEVPGLAPAGLPIWMPYSVRECGFPQKFCVRVCRVLTSFELACLIFSSGHPAMFFTFFVAERRDVMCDHIFLAQGRFVGYKQNGITAETKQHDAFVPRWWSRTKRPQLLFAFK